MSTYNKITRHPATGEFENAKWIDDYYGPHQYGVEFPSDGKVFPPELVNASQLKEFWAQDVIDALISLGANDEELLEFLAELQKMYRARWERDPANGEGSVENLMTKRER